MNKYSLKPSKAYFINYPPIFTKFETPVRQKMYLWNTARIKKRKELIRVSDAKSKPLSLITSAFKTISKKKKKSVQKENKT
jgi:hypothetical protein